MTYGITDLVGKALQAAIAEERAAEWDKKSIDRQTIIDFSTMNKTQYDKNGHFIRYGKTAE